MPLCAENETEELVFFCPNDSRIKVQEQPTQLIRVYYKSNKSKNHFIEAITSTATDCLKEYQSHVQSTHLIRILSRSDRQ